MRPPLPPLTHETAALKVRLAEDAWNSRDPETVAQAYTSAGRWRNRDEFITGRDAIVAFLTRKWMREQDYRLIKELWAFGGDRISVRFVYEWYVPQGRWFRAYGNENWVFDADDLTAERNASINELQFDESDQLFRWPQGRHPDDLPSLCELGFEQ